MWTAEDNSSTPSTACTTYPQPHPHHRWMPSRLSTAVLHLSTASSTVTPDQHLCIGLYVSMTSTSGAPASHQLSTCAHSYPQSYPPHPSDVWLAAAGSGGVAWTPTSAPVIYTGGHFSTRMGYLSTKMRRRVWPPVARNVSDALVSRACLSAATCRLLSTIPRVIHIWRGEVARIVDDCICAD